MAKVQKNTALIKENWRLAYAQRRLVILQSALEALVGLVDASFKEKARFTFEDVLLCADALDGIDVMPGPTGETNELYVVGRGDVAVIGLPLALDNEAGGLVVFIAQTLCALITGNSVKLIAMSAWCAEFVKQVQKILFDAGVPEPIVTVNTCPNLGADSSGNSQSINEIEIASLGWLFGGLAQISLDDAQVKKTAPNLVMANAQQTDSTMQINMSDFALIAPVGSKQAVAMLSLQAAEYGLENQSAILQLAPAHDLEAFSDIVTPAHIYRFVTERVRTINTTAIGGNASLIEASAG